jgi:two-component system sensor histidine kinase KdpD
VPAKRIAYRSVALEEMDLDAVLVRRPAIALVDELAHTNVVGARHEKRWQDVEAMLDAGVGVVSTLNVHHLEHLRDVVRWQTGIDVRELVPMRIIDRADDLEIVDARPEQLRKRLHEGRIDVHRAVGVEVEAFFRERNLEALRSLAHRELARFTAHASTVRGANRPDGAAPLMVAMSSRRSPTERLLNVALRLASERGCPWYAVYVRTPREAPSHLDWQALEDVTRNVRLATELGAQVVTLDADDIAVALAAFARGHGVEQMLVGRTRRSRIGQRLFTSVLEELLRAAPELDVVVVGEDAQTS